jgi:cysteine desulfurase / selenocysteine lyase
MIYLNNAATSFPKPQNVIDAVHEYMYAPPFHSSRAGFERQKEDIVYYARENLAKLLNVDEPLNIIFTSGSTESLNLAIYGIPFEGKHFVTTGIEHNSVLRPLKHLELEGKISMTIVPCDENAYVEPQAIGEAIQDDTIAVVVNHSSNVTGSILDLKAIAKIAHDKDCFFIVDGSQSTGNIPIDLNDWDVDLFAFTGHKSLYGLQGVGGLYIKPGIELRPLIVGGTGTKSEVMTQPEGMPIYYEAGTPNMPGIISLAAGTDFIFKEGLENIKAHKVKLVKKMMNELKEYPGIRVLNTEERNSLSNFCFTVDKMVPEEVGYILDSSYDIIVRTGLHCAPLLLEPLGVHPWGTIRTSPSYFTKEEEIDIFIAAVKDIADMGQKKKK